LSQDKCLDISTKDEHTLINVIMEGDGNGTKIKFGIKKR
jgi:hypothetical protein